MQNICIFSKYMIILLGNSKIFGITVFIWIFLFSSLFSMKTLWSSSFDRGMSTVLMGVMTLSMTFTDIGALLSSGNGVPGAYAATVASATSTTVGKNPMATLAGTMKRLEQRLKEISSSSSGKYTDTQQAKLVTLLTKISDASEEVISRLDDTIATLDHSLDNDPLSILSELLGESIDKSSSNDVQIVKLADQWMKKIDAGIAVSANSSQKIAYYTDVKESMMEVRDAANGVIVTLSANTSSPVPAKTNTSVTFSSWTSVISTATSSTGTTTTNVTPWSCQAKSLAFTTNWLTCNGVAPTDAVGVTKTISASLWKWSAVIKCDTTGWTVVSSNCSNWYTTNSTPVTTAPVSTPTKPNSATNSTSTSSITTATPTVVQSPIGSLGAKITPSISTVDSNTRNFTVKYEVAGYKYCRMEYKVSGRSGFQDKNGTLDYRTWIADYSTNGYSYFKLYCMTTEGSYSEANVVAKAEIFKDCSGVQDAATGINTKYIPHGGIKKFVWNTGSAVFACNNGVISVSPNKPLQGDECEVQAWDWSNGTRLARNFTIDSSQVNTITYSKLKPTSSEASALCKTLKISQWAWKPDLNPNPLSTVSWQISESKNGTQLEWSWACRYPYFSAWTINSAGACVK